MPVLLRLKDRLEDETADEKLGRHSLWQTPAPKPVGHLIGMGTKRVGMAPDGFRDDDIVNRRVNRHVRRLLPETTSGHRDYSLEGQRYLLSEHLPGRVDSCLCYLEAYVGTKGTFEIQITRRFNPETAQEWRCSNRIRRSSTAGGGSLAPFEYRVTTRLELGDTTERDRARVSWEGLRVDPIYGGRESQAAALLAEKMAHRRARETDGDDHHHGSLSYLGSLARVIDRGRSLPVTWEDVDSLLGPEAETIAATTGFERLESDAKRLEARKKGIDFLSETLGEELDAYEGSRDRTEHQADRRPEWQTLPPDMDADTASRKLAEMQRQLRDMREEL